MKKKEQKKFRVYLGDEKTSPFVIEKGMSEEGLNQNLIREVPEEYREHFHRDIKASVRELMGFNPSVIYAPNIPNWTGETLRKLLIDLEKGSEPNGIGQS